MDKEILMYEIDAPSKKNRYDKRYIRWTGATVKGTKEDFKVKQYATGPNGKITVYNHLFLDVIYLTVLLVVVDYLFLGVIHLPVLLVVVVDLTHQLVLSYSNI